MLFFVLRIFWAASSSCRFQHGIWFCTISEQIHGTFHGEELPFRSENFAHISRSALLTLQRFPFTIRIKRDSAFGSSRSRPSHPSHTIYFAILFVTHGPSGFTSSLCLGLLLVLFFHHGTFGLHLAQWVQISTPQHSHSKPSQFFQGRSCDRLVTY